MKQHIYLFLVLLLLYSCSPINKQHGYLMDDLLISSDKISEFEPNITTRDEIFQAMGSPSIKISDVDDIWIYLISVKENNVFEDDVLLFQNIYRFSFDTKGILKMKSSLDQNDFNQISFSSDKTTVRREAYSITDQLYDAFTRGL
tara:strand:- start:197 stop:631 length:435 start_codon:yes stop_codon:yes gene_type:complete